MNCINMFQDLWGGRETTYSAVIAQTMYLMPEFDSFIRGKCAIPDDAVMIRIATEESLSTIDRIDIYVEYDGYIVGIENKKWAGLQDKQLQRYADSLQQRANSGTKSCLLFMAPSRYQLQETDIPKKTVPLIRIDYKDVIAFFKSYSPSTSFETKYCEKLIEFLEVLEINPISQAELDSLASVPLIDSFLRKTRVILEDIRDNEKDGKIEENRNNYRLFCHKSGPFPIYVGYRFSSDWYCNAPLLDGKSECIIYVKDVWDDPDQQRYNNELERIFADLAADVKKMGPGNDVQKFERKKKDECRIMIRRSLPGVVNEDIGTITNWYKSILAKLEEKLPKD